MLFIIVFIQEIIILLHSHHLSFPVQNNMGSHRFQLILRHFWSKLMLLDQITSCYQSTTITTSLTVNIDSLIQIAVLIYEINAFSDLIQGRNANVICDRHLLELDIQPLPFLNCYAVLQLMVLIHCQHCFDVLGSDDLLVVSLHWQRAQNTVLIDASVPFADTDELEKAAKVQGWIHGQLVEKCGHCINRLARI